MIGKAVKNVIGLVQGLAGLVSTGKELLVQRYCYQLIVPEYKVRHLGSSLYQLQKWRDCYPEDTQSFILFPKKLGF